MARVTKTYITTDDTNQTFEFPREWDENNEQLWEVKISHNYVSDSGHAQGSSYSPAIFYVTRKTLEKLGMVPRPKEETPPPEKQKDEVREVLEHLLSLVGVYLTE